MCSVLQSSAVKLLLSPEVKIFQQALSLSPGNSQINGDLMVQALGGLRRVGVAVDAFPRLPWDIASLIGDVDVAVAAALQRAEAARANEGGPLSLHCRKQFNTRLVFGTIPHLANLSLGPNLGAWRCFSLRPPTPSAPPPLAVLQSLLQPKRSEVARRRLRDDAPMPKSESA